MKMTEYSIWTDQELIDRITNQTTNIVTRDMFISRDLIIELVNRFDEATRQNESYEYAIRRAQEYLNDTLTQKNEE